MNGLSARNSGAVDCGALRSKAHGESGLGVADLGLDCGRERRLRCALLRVGVEDEVEVHHTSVGRRL